LGLTPAHFQVLSVVAASPGCIQQLAVERLGLTKGAVFMGVIRLEEQGLLTRVPAGAAYELSLTAEGRTQVARLRPAHAAFLAGQFACLDDEELATLTGLLRRL